MIVSNRTISKLRNLLILTQHQKELKLIMSKKLTHGLLEHQEGPFHSPFLILLLSCIYVCLLLGLEVVSSYNFITHGKRYKTFIEITCVDLIRHQLLLLRSQMISVSILQNTPKFVGLNRNNLFSVLLCDLVI